MKKTLIALAVAASAAVSGSAMAWTANGNGGSVDLGGTLTPQNVITPWEVKVGAAVNGLDADIRKGDTKVNIMLKNSIPVLGIRVADAVQKTFIGGSGIVPQIDYHGAIDTNAFNGGTVPVNLNVNNAKDQKIGTMVVDMIAYGESSWNDGAYAGKKQLFADNAGSAFFGGLGRNESSVFSDGLFERVAAIDPEFVANYTDQNGEKGDVGVELFDTPAVFSGFYGSGIEQGKIIKITLDQAATGDTPIQWKASLPITVSYA
ncbi:F4 family fimbrial subunit [Escherichia coli]|uniref:F4 family fimbrial subunit n=1 Tax=Escherichia coli TaxID=562 RepID=UPI0021572399|nr:hypothetical protein [Escherichia coli]